MKTGPKPRPISVRFWEKVVRKGDDECWLWTGQRNSRGYGVFLVGSRTDGSRRQVVASRLSMELTGVVIPSHLQVCHRCDNPPCVNPAHLFVGTAKENMQDALSKGRLRQPDHAREICKAGHPYTDDNTRWVDGYKHCRQCTRDASNRYYARHPEKEADRRKRYREENRETINAKALAYYHARSEDIKPKMRNYYHANKPK